MEYTVRVLGPDVRGLVWNWPEGGATNGSWRDWRPALMEELRRLQDAGVRKVETRVVVQQADLDPSLVRERHEAVTGLVRSLGFEPFAGRKEFRVPLDQAIAGLAPPPEGPSLSWTSVSSAPGDLIERAARLVSAAAVGDPESDPDDDALGFLLARGQDPALSAAPECVQLGQWDARDAVIMIANVKPATGECGFHYLAVARPFRGRGLGALAMAHGLEVMRKLGGRVYHDGTSTLNAPALALLGRLGMAPWREVEQWRLNLAPLT